MKNDGGYLENEFQKALKKTKLLSFYWRRLYDAKSVGTNKVPAQPADFFLSSKLSGASHVEVKSRAGKTFRLAKFDQEADLRRWSAAGVPGYVLVHFYQTGDTLYLVNVRDLTPGLPSWKIDHISETFKNMDEVVRRFA
jgi:hypothetical protein